MENDMTIPRIMALLAVVGVFNACDVVEPSVTPPDDIQAARLPDGGMGRFLVEYSGNSDRIVAAVQAAGGQVGRVHESIEVLEVTGLSAQALTKLPGVQHATADAAIGRPAGYPIEIPPYELGGLALRAYELDPASTPNVNPADAYFFPCQWNLQRIQAPQAWATGARGAGAKVALIDTGVQHDHIDLRGKVDLARSRNFVTIMAPGCPAEDWDPSLVIDYDTHGTMVASLVATNNIGMAGAAPDATIVMLKVYPCDGSNASFADILAAIMYAADLDLDIISMSLAGDVPRGRLVAVAQKVVNYATSRGKLIIGTAGNDAVDLGRMKNVVRVPTMLANVYSAYATNHLDQLAAHSSYGNTATWVGAPTGARANYAGPAIASCPAGLPVQNRIPLACSGDVNWFPLNLWCKDGSTSTYLFYGVGTSFATPTLAGVAALVGGTRTGGFNAHQLATILAQTADDLGAPGVDNFYSHGRVNAARAVQRR
jgi:lantibiotic leader peptide-processing serine protease